MGGYEAVAFLVVWVVAVDCVVGSQGLGSCPQSTVVEGSKEVLDMFFPN